MVIFKVSIWSFLKTYVMKGAKINIIERKELVAGLQKTTEADGKVVWAVLIQEFQ